MGTSNSLIESEGNRSIAGNNQLVPGGLLARSPEHGSKLETKNIGCGQPWRPGVEARERW